MPPSSKPLARKLKKSAQEASPALPLLNPFSKTCDKVVSARSLIIRELAPERDEVHLALVSLPPFPDLKNRLQEKTIWQAKDETETDLIDACRRRLVSHRRGDAKTLLEMYEEALRVAAVDLQADIVCFNELGFPALNQKPLKRAAQLTRQLAESERCLIVAGSAHDGRTLYNTSCLFYPGCPSSGVPYHKQVSALSTGELVSVPAKRQTICTRVFGLNLAVLICLDLADFSAVASVVKNSDRVDLLLVPCYTEYTDSLKRVAQAASAALRGFVVLVNYHSSSEPACIVEEFGKPSRLVARAPRQLASGGVIHSLPIRPQALRQKKLEIKDSTEERFEWLFGAQNLEAR